MKDIELTPAKIVILWLVTFAIIALIWFAQNNDDFTPVNEGMNGNIGGSLK